MPVTSGAFRLGGGTPTVCPGPRPLRVAGWSATPTRWTQVDRVGAFESPRARDRLLEILNLKGGERKDGDFMEGVEGDSIGLTSCFANCLESASRGCRRPREVKAKLLESACNGVGDPAARTRETGRSRRAGQWTASALNFCPSISIKPKGHARTFLLPCVFVTPAIFFLPG